MTVYIVIGVLSLVAAAYSTHMLVWLNSHVPPHLRGVYTHKHKLTLVGVMILFTVLAIIMGVAAAEHGKQQSGWEKVQHKYLEPPLEWTVKTIRRAWKS
ncbi:MAG: hypothetical protein WAX89_06020 [Alphaproteobacteria bacterium]